MPKFATIKNAFENQGRTLHGDDGLLLRVTDSQMLPQRGASHMQRRPERTLIEGPEPCYQERPLRGTSLCPPHTQAPVKDFPNRCSGIDKHLLNLLYKEEGAEQ